MFKVKNKDIRMTSMVFFMQSDIAQMSVLFIFKIGRFLS